MYKFNERTLKWEKVKLWKYVLTALGLCTIIVVSSSFVQQTPEIQYIETEAEINLVTSEDFSEQAFLEEVGRYNFRYPQVIIAQARLESNNFTSPVFMECNNLFGMKQAKSRLTLARESCRGYAYYDSWKTSLQDRALYEASYTHKLKSKSQYIQYLDRLYAEDGSYAIKLNNFIKKI